MTAEKSAEEHLDELIQQHAAGSCLSGSCFLFPIGAGVFFAFFFAVGGSAGWTHSSIERPASVFFEVAGAALGSFAAVTTNTDAPHKRIGLFVIIASAAILAKVCVFLFLPAELSNIVMSALCVGTVAGVVAWLWESVITPHMRQVKADSSGKLAVVIKRFQHAAPARKKTTFGSPSVALRWLLAATCVIRGAAISREDGRHVKCTRQALSVGHTNLTKATFKEYVKTHDALVGFASGSCETCCYAEDIYAEIIPQLPSSVNFVRIYVDKYKSLASKHGVDELPALLFFKQGVRHPYFFQSYHHPDTILSFVHKILHPMAPLQSEDDIRDFLTPALFFPTNSSRERCPSPPPSLCEVSPGHWVRGILVGAPGSLDEDDETELIEAARRLSGRNGYRFGRIESPLLFGSVRNMVKDYAGHQAGCTSPTLPYLMLVSLFDNEFVSSRHIKVRHKGPDILSPPTLAYSEDKATLWEIGLRVSLRRVSSSLKAANAAEEPDLWLLPRVECRSLDEWSRVGLYEWLVSASLPHVGEFSPITSSLYESARKPILTLFADTNDDRFLSWLSILEQSARDIRQRTTAEGRGVAAGSLGLGGQSDAKTGMEAVLFAYVDGRLHGHRMKPLGLQSERLPALAFNFMTTRVLSWQPSKKGREELTKDVVDSLIHRFLFGDDVGRKRKHVPAPQPKKVPERNVTKGERRVVRDLDTLSIDQRLEYVTPLDSDSFDELVQDVAKDVLVYFYASKDCQACLEHAIFVNRCAERFAELKIGSIVVTRFDMSKYALPVWIQQVDALPALIIFPAFDKDPPFRRFVGQKWKVQYIMWWAQQHASIKFHLPELPHLDELERQAYHEQKAQMDADRGRLERETLSTKDEL
ncbi:unnamed protein product [Vitrella brassicaformis CCMP3155]|uniref:Thioredoxin domain-containing protein n=2 Tax=Vitrella brassicaformis TaxID=1169539 RepID=A0A0G4F9V9_VITBC|nr:unnamed protein product [Vitrella brassicaformis CCMP3155]|eukprot:CEM09669.1 unnamed protein product [Vitrella brassicaformis CCMP3155]